MLLNSFTGMKDNYIAPLCETIRITTEACLCAGSTIDTPGSHTQGGATYYDRPPEFVGEGDGGDDEEAEAKRSGWGLVGSDVWEDMPW